MFYIVFFVISINYLNLGTVLLYFNIMEVFGLNISLRFMVDFFSLFFCIIVCLITRVVIGYSLFYMGKLNSNRFIYLVFLFSLSMLILIFRGNFFIIMIG